eukprot:gene1786-biopygen11108
MWTYPQARGLLLCIHLPQVGSLSRFCKLRFAGGQGRTMPLDIPVTEVSRSPEAMVQYVVMSARLGRRTPAPTAVFPLPQLPYAKNGARVSAAIRQNQNEENELRCHFLVHLGAFLVRTAPGRILGLANGLHLSTICRQLLAVSDGVHFSRLPQAPAL